MIIIADSGATKTDWMVISGKSQKEISTSGINPFHQTEDRIDYVISGELMPELKYYNFDEPDEIYFYGAGCLPESSLRVGHILEKSFRKAKIEINTDLMGAARALCKNSPGIACILGTGANSCEYDGSDITKNVSPLGYILGDEGSGAYIGKRFIGDCLKGQFPVSLKDGLLEEYRITVDDILDKVYREQQANRFLASVVPYIHRHKSEGCVNDFLKDCFAEFFKRNLTTYDKKLKVSFAGSVSWFFRDEIAETAVSLGYTIGKFVKKPIKGLVEYHSTLKRD